MRFQQNRASCGPASLHNALQALGFDRSEDELIKLAGQTPNGTSQGGLLRAIKAIGSDLVGDAVRWGKGDQAVVGLWWYLAERGRPLILCVDSFEHWVACTGYLGYRFAVVDSADSAMMLYYNQDDLLRRWEGPKGGFHAIVV